LADSTFEFRVELHMEDDMKVMKQALRLSVFVITLIATLTVAISAGAETEEEIQAKRDFWQQKYRALRYNKASNLENAARMKYAHEQAQLSNYPRGGERERLLVEWRAYLRKADEVQKELDGIWDKARAAGIPPGWLYEVEDEPIVLKDVPEPTPAAPSEDDGRNPLYRDRSDE